MDTYVRFLYEFMSVFFKGIGTIFSGIFGGIIQMFNKQRCRYSYKNGYNRYHD